MNAIGHNRAREGWQKIAGTFEQEDGHGWADRFDRTMKEAVLSHHYKIPIGYEKVPDTGLAVPTEEEEPYEVMELSEGVYLLNWIEASELVVSQVDDFNNGKVTAFMTWPDEKARGKRASLLHKGILTVID